MTPSVDLKSQFASEQQKLTAFCEEWEGLLESDLLKDDEELDGMARSAVGRGRMLLKGRIAQFQQLMKDSEEKTSDKPILQDDLLGLWDMIGFQLEDLEKDFQKLHDAKAQNAQLAN